VSRRRGLGLVAIALAAVAAVAILVIGFSGPSPSSFGGLLEEPITVKRGLSTAAVRFGDRVDAEVDVYTRDGTVASESVHVEAAFGRFTTVSRSVEREHRGPVSLLRTRVVLQCLTRACLPPRSGGQLVQLPPLTVRYRENGRNQSRVVAWGPLQLSSRIPPGATDSIGVIDAAPPLRPGFARSAGAIRTGLLLLTAILALGGVALVVSAIWPRVFPTRRQARISPLERSLIDVEAAAQSNDEVVRRRTLDRLAICLAEADAPQLELQTRALAWGESPPGRDALAALASRVRSSLNGGVRS